MLDDDNPVLAVLGAENADEPVSVLIGVDDRSEAQGVLREARPFRPFAGLAGVNGGDAASFSRSASILARCWPESDRGVSSRISSRLSVAGGSLC